MNDWERIKEIHRLLDEAYRHYFENSDGYCKSSEGALSVNFGNYFERRDREDSGQDPMVIHGVEVYSYVLGPHRSHYFKSATEALTTVRGWHKAEMEHDYSEDGWD